MELDVAGNRVVASITTEAVDELVLVHVPARPAQPGAVSVVRDLAEGWRFVRGRVWLWATFASAAVAYLCFMGPSRSFSPTWSRMSSTAVPATWAWCLQPEVSDPSRAPAQLQERVGHKLGDCDGHPTFGGTSMAIDPEGTVLAEAGPTGEELLRVEIGGAGRRDARTRYLELLRPSVYGSRGPYW